MELLLTKNVQYGSVAHTHVINNDMAAGEWWFPDTIEKILLKPSGGSLRFLVAGLLSLEFNDQWEKI